jgi:CxxC motif-containing protein (DUF1111 family)
MDRLLTFVKHADRPEVVEGFAKFVKELRPGSKRDEAIRLHGGEASQAAHAYRALSTERRTSLLRFPNDLSLTPST